MLSACEVLVATDARDLSDSLVNELRQRGALVVSIEEAEAVAEVLDGGVRPDVLVVDGVLPDGDGIVHRIRAALRAPSLPVVTICPATAESPPVPGTHLAQRSVSDVVDLLDEVAQPRSAFRPGDFTLNP